MPRKWPPKKLMVKGVVPRLGNNSRDPTDPIGRLLFSGLGMMAELLADLIRRRTREGMAVAKAKGQLKDGQPLRTNLWADLFSTGQFHWPPVGRP
jgi:DNA invertase Pin-like site-specific DNA recombinase